METTVTVNYLVIGQQRYGYGETLLEAKANFKRLGGRLSEGYDLFDFVTPGAVFHHVDGFDGTVYFDNEKPEPLHTYHAPRKGARR